MARHDRTLTPLSDIELEQAFASQGLDRSMFRRLLPLLQPVYGQVLLVLLLLLVV